MQISISVLVSVSMMDHGETTKQIYIYLSLNKKRPHGTHGPMSGCLNQGL